MLLGVLAVTVLTGARVAVHLWLDRDGRPLQSPPPVFAIDPRLTGTMGTGGSTIVAGDCWDESSGVALTDHARTQRVVEVSCAGWHGGETVLLLRLPDAPGAPFPGEQRLQDVVLPRCLLAFERYVGVPYERSDLDLVVHQPSPTTWTRSDDREAMCSVRNQDGTPMALSVRHDRGGSGQPISWWP